MTAQRILLPLRNISLLQRFLASCKFNGLVVAKASRKKLEQFLTCNGLSESKGLVISPYIKSGIPKCR